METLLHLLISSILGIILISAGFLSGKYPQIIAGYDKKKPLSRDRIDLMKKSLIIAGIVTIVGCTICILLNCFFLYFLFLVVPSFVAPIFISYKTKSSPTLAIILCVVLISIIAFGYYAIQEPVVTTDKEKTTISGLYGETIVLKDIKQIDLTNSIPHIELRTNGFALGEVRKGYFRLEGMENVKLFLSSKQAPFIVIKTSDRTFILNSEEPSTTKATYESIKLNCGL